MALPLSTQTFIAEYHRSWTTLAFRKGFSLPLQPGGPGPLPCMYRGKDSLASMIRNTLLVGFCLGFCLFVFVSYSYVSVTL